MCNRFRGYVRRAWNFADPGLNYTEVKPAKFGLGPSSVLRLVFLLSAGDVERNPGPKKRVYKHPCGVCQSPVRSNQRGILCEVCYKWFHTKCIGVSNDDTVVCNSQTRLGVVRPVSGKHYPITCLMVPFSTLLPLVFSPILSTSKMT